MSASFDEDVATLVASDPTLEALVAAHGVPEFWTRPNTFASVALSILEQQVSLSSAAATFGRIVGRIGAMTPQGVLADGDLRAAGVTRQKQRYLLALARAVDDGSLDLAALPTLPDDEVRARLCALPGIGRWTADVYLLACLHRGDVWPVGDRALQVAVSETLGLASVPTAADLEGLGERWRPLRSTAARLLWHGYLVRRGRVETAVV